MFVTGRESTHFEPGLVVADFLAEMDVWRTSVGTCDAVFSCQPSCLVSEARLRRGRVGSAQCTLPVFSLFYYIRDCDTLIP